MTPGSEQSLTAPILTPGREQSLTTPILTPCSWQSQTTPILKPGLQTRSAFAREASCPVRPAAQRKREEVRNHEFGHRDSAEIGVQAPSVSALQ